MSEKEKHAADEHAQECARRSQEEKHAADEHAYDLCCMAEEDLAADKRLRRSAQERAREDRKTMEKCVHDDLEFEAYNIQTKLDQERERLHVDTLIMMEEDFQARCNDEIAFDD